MDLTYQNNKGLYAFLMAFVVMLTVLLPTTSTHAATTYAPTEDFKVIRVVQNTTGLIDQYSNTPAMSFRHVRLYEDWVDKFTGFTVINKDTGEDISSSFTTEKVYYSSSRAVQFLYSGDKAIPGGTQLEITVVFSEKIPVTAFNGNTFLETDGIISSDFFQNAPPVDVKVPIVVKEVTELPLTMGKVAGILILLGSMILGVLLTAGSVKRFLSSFLR